MQAKHNLLGKTFNRLTAIGFVGRDKWGNAKWLWRCVCGQEKVILGSSVKGGHAKSCGCWHREATINRNIERVEHGGCGTPEYSAWCGLVQRGTNPNIKQSADYIGRGITVCGNLRTFEGFLAAVGKRLLPELSIDRKDNDGNYSCGTCGQCVANGWAKNIRWATRAEQNRNTRSNHLITHDGLTLTLAEWSERLGFPHPKLSMRLQRGWSVERALSTP